MKKIDNEFNNNSIEVEQNNKDTTKKKYSGLSIAAFICALTIILFPIAIILSILDFIIHKSKKKHIFSIIALVISGLLIFIIILGNSNNKLKDDKYINNIPISSYNTEISTINPTNTPKVELTEKPTEEPKNEKNILDELLEQENITRDMAEAIYFDIEKEFASEDSLYYDLNVTAEQIDEWENNVVADVAKKYNITADTANKIYIYISMGYFFHYDISTVPITYGELVNANITGFTLIVKTKITPSLTNDLTIKQNYFNACDIIRSFGDNHFSELQYWAVADMTDGSEGKVISFTVPKSTIELITKNKFADSILVDYVQDLWILPSLQKK